MMDGNKMMDEVERCIEVAEAALSLGDRARAERLILKAEGLYPTQRAKSLLELLKNLGEAESTARKRTDSGPKAQPCGASESSGPVYTECQQASVRKILSLSVSDHYQILGVKKGATDSDLKKAYRKLSLQCHPDKNAAPGSTEAFQAIGNSFAILSDPEKRKLFDEPPSDSATNADPDVGPDGTDPQNETCPENFDDAGCWFFEKFLILIELVLIFSMVWFLAHCQLLDIPEFWSDSPENISIVQQHGMAKSMVCCLD